MSKTVVGLFSTIAEAEQVKQTLSSNGYDASNIKVVANDATNETLRTDSADTRLSDDDSAYAGHTGIGEKISNFFRSLTGGDEDVHNHYASGVNSGGALLAVTTDDARAMEVAALLKQHGARDIDSSYERSASAGIPAYDRNDTNLSGEQTIPVVEEELVVGKREVDRGGVRVYTHVSERPVEADVTLHDERISVERRAVNRPATAADFEAGRGSTIELRAQGEEAVVGKSQRVVEEIHVGKQSTDHTEAIHDSVRKTEVDVENVAASITRETDQEFADTTSTGSTNRY